MRVLPLLAVIVFVAGCSGAETADRDAATAEFFAPPGAAESGLPFSDAVRVGNLLFLSGKIGIKPGTMELAAGGVGPETRQTLESIAASLERYGSDMDHVVKCTVFLADIADWPAMNAVYVEFFPNNKPARSALGTSGLALDSRVEIECIAAIP